MAFLEALELHLGLDQVLHQRGVDPSLLFCLFLVIGASANTSPRDSHYCRRQDKRSQKVFNPKSTHSDK
jgi:hypothetical protein